MTPPGQDVIAVDLMGPKGASISSSHEVGHGKRRISGRGWVWALMKEFPLGGGGWCKRPANTERPVSFVRFSPSLLVEGEHPLQSNFVLVYFLLIVYVFVVILKEI